MRRNNNSKILVDTLIIGGGFAGLSTAYHLAKKGQKNTVVIEHEHKLGGHASGRNAGMIRQAISDPVLAKLAHEGRNFLSQCGKNGWKGAALDPHGSLLLAKDGEINELRKTEAILKKEGLSCRRFSRQKAEQFVPLLKNGDFKEAIFCKSDAMVDVNSLIRGFYQALKRYHVKVLMGHTLGSIEKKNGYFHVRAGNKFFIAKRIVNAAGAWAGSVAQKAKATPISLKAYRRHLLLAKKFYPFNASWPFVWDLSHNFYFRPQGKFLLLSPCDKSEVKNIRTAVRKETIDRKISGILRQKLSKFSDQFDTISFQNIKSGLRTMTPDGRFVIGEDPKLKGFFWVAGLGGHGVTTSFSVGNLASDLILGRNRLTFLAKALSPARFTRTR